MTHARAECGHIWRKARPANDWKAVAPALEKLVGYAREAAKAKADVLGLPLYDALIDQYDPGRTSAQIDSLFGELAAELPVILDEVLARQDAAPDPVQPMGDFSTERQRRLGEEVMRVLLFDFHHGRFDVSAHPFSGGATGDRRITTRYDESDFTKALMGTIHETGHSQYESGLPQEWAYQPVGCSRGMTLHESQSLLFEMQAGRSEEFIRFLAPLARAELAGEGDGWEPDNLIRIYQRVRRSLIRVDADEVTYPLHVMLRYRLEKALMEGDLEVADLPAAWNDTMEELIGIRPPHDADGVMQDVHWYEGIFGYFPTYTLGAMTAAQLFAALKQAVPNVLEDVGHGNWEPLLGWLRANVHSQGCRFTPDGLIEHASGAPLTARPFLAHLRARYLNEAA
jgi:carboxypeptidase Taq